MSVAFVWQQSAPGVGLNQRGSKLSWPRLVRPSPTAATHRCIDLPGLNQHPAQRLSPVHAGQHTGPNSGSGDADHQQQPWRQDPGHEQQKQKQKQRPGPLQSLFFKIVLLLRVLGTVALLVAALPAIVSSRLGTAAAAAAASRMLPGDVQIQRISLGWTQPLAVYGLSIFEGAAGSSRQLIGLQRFSSAEPLHQVVTGKADHLTLTLTNPSIDCSLTDAGDNFRIVRYLEQSSLLGVLLGKRSAAAAGADTTQQQGASSSKAAAAAAAAAASIHSHPIQVTDTTTAEEEVDGPLSSSPARNNGDGAVPAISALTQPAATKPAVQAAGAAAAAAAGAAAIPTASSSSSVGSPAQLPSALPANFLQRLATADASSQVSAELRLPMVSVYIPDGQLLLPQEMAAAMGSHIHAVAAVGASAVEDLASELEEDCSWLQAQQQQQQQQPGTQQQPQQPGTQQQPQQPGTQQQPQQPGVHQQPQQPAAQQQQQGVQQEPQQQQQQNEQDGSTADAAHARWPLPPPSVSRKLWVHATPLMLQVSGERVSALVRGWHIGSVWRFSKSSFVLQQPATADWEFTPELAALTLSQFNPLLEEVALIRESGQLMTSIAPAEGRLPAERGQLYVSPVKLVVGKGNLLSQIYRLLGLHGRFGSHAHSPSRPQPWLSAGSSGSSTAAAAAREVAAAAEDDGSAMKGVEVWSGPLRVRLEGPGKFRTDRVDMLLGSGRNSLHLALWGTLDTNSNTLEMTVGLPAETLAKAGLRGLPPGYMLPVAVSGPLHRPQVEWNAAVRQLAVLSAMQLGREAWRVEGERAAEALWGAVSHQEGPSVVPAGIAGLLGAANRALSKAASSFIGQVDERLQNVLQNVPPPAELPWESEGTARHGKAHHHTPSHPKQHQQSTGPR